MAHDFARTRATADRMIRNWGQPAVLRSVAGDRPCTVAVMNFSAMERMGKLIDPVDRKALLSALAPDGSVLADPDYTREQLITFVMDGDKIAQPQTVDERLTIVAPAGRVGTSAMTVMWRLQVRA